MPTYNPSPSYVTDGESVNATVTNRAPLVIQDNVAYLKSIIDSMTNKEAVVLYTAPASTTVTAPGVVAWNTSNARFEPAIASGSTLSNALGLCINKPSTTTADIVLYGKAVIDITSIIDSGTLANDRYYLSQTTAGKVVSSSYLPQATNTTYQIPILIADGTDTVYVMPEFGSQPVKRINLTGTTTDGFVVVYDATNSAGLLGVAAIKNTHGSNSLSFKEEFTDIYTNTYSTTATVTNGAYATRNLLATVGTVYPPYTEYKVSIKSTSAGNAATYNFNLTFHI